MVVSEDEILVSVTIPQLIKDEFIKKGTLQLLPNGDPVLYTGGFAMVFPVVVDKKKWAFRCWRATLSDLQQRYKYIWDYLKASSLPYFCKGEYIEKGIVVGGTLMPTSRMEWVDGIELKDYVIKYQRQPEKIYALAEEFRQMCVDIHNSKISHGDLQHGNILICEKMGGKPALKLVDYDSLYVPTMGQKFKDSITGLKDYQHPARQTAGHVSSHKTDYFSELVIYLSLIAIAENPALCLKYEVEDRDALLFTLADFRNLKASKIYGDLTKLSENVKMHLNVLVDYLKVNDIEKLEPFMSLVNIDNILEEVKSKFAAAKKINTIAAYKQFLNDCPDTSYTKEYRVKAQNEIDIFQDVILWTATVASGTIEAYSRYLDSSKKLSYAHEARKKVEELSWAKASRAGTETEYENYLNISSTKGYALEAYLAIEDLYYSAGIRKASVESYNNYLTKSKKLKIKVDRFAISYKKQSDPKYKEYLQKVAENTAKISGLLGVLENKLWTLCQSQNTVVAYDNYLKLFPNGKYATQCKSRIEQIKASELEEELWKRAKMGHSFTSYRNYLNTTTIGKYKKEANMGIARCEDELWKKAVSINTKEAYQRYLQQSVLGKYRTAAENEISNIEFKSTLKKIAAVVLIVGAIIFAGIRINSRSDVSSHPDPFTPIQVEAPVSHSVNLTALEQEVNNKLIALELQKKHGRPLDQAIYNRAKNILNDLKKYGSPKYHAYKTRFDKL
ncbi:MAG: hypothetical protein IKV05_00380 [Bacteroidales bacterium]|nr:hypothetical protein [Bacteroidales bacterium]